MAGVLLQRVGEFDRGGGNAVDKVGATAGGAEVHEFVAVYEVQNSRGESVCR